jgi:MYXO-CTERM domain-containing protein
VNAPNGYCTTACDPYQAVDQCPQGLRCGPASNNPADGYFCQLTSHHASGGCSTAPGSGPVGVAAGVLLALALLFVARRARH